MRQILRGLCLTGLLALPAAAAFADSSGTDWSSSYGFAGTAKHQTNMVQADLIAKKESDYYNGLGKTVVNNISTTSVGTMTTSTTTIDGFNNTVGIDSQNTGGLNASMSIHSPQVLNPIAP